MCKLPDLQPYRRELATAIGATGPAEAVEPGSKIAEQLEEYSALNKFLVRHRASCDECEAALAI